MLGSSPIATAADHEQAVRLVTDAYRKIRDDHWWARVEKLGLPAHLAALMQPPTWR